MGRVVRLETSGSERRNGSGPAAQVRRRSTARRPGRPSKTALVLGGGGVTGAVYEIGALRALDLLSVNRSVTDFDVYVGTSAGSLVAAMTANGITPEEMMRVVNRQVPTPFPDVDLKTVLALNVRELVGSALSFPFRAAKLTGRLLGQLGQVSALDVVLGLAEGMPSGLYSGGGIESYVRAVLDGEGRSDDFRELTHELYLTATDLDTAERVVFGQPGFDDVPISTAVRASTALPMVYKPVRIGDRELVDGGIVSTTNLDIAVEAGARLLIVVNPLVPYVNDVNDPEAPGRKRISDMGFPQVGYQTFKLIAHNRLHEMKRQWEQRYPGVDIVLIEPDPSDELMFRTSVMDYRSRVSIARHGFRSVTQKLSADYPRLRRVAARHGIEISATRVNKVVKHFATAEPAETARWRAILEQTRSTLLRQSASD
ncbi:patatin-like phospholipase family protein [Conexibacter sp. CPCC 206217]|uniref:patatin-like phospholipase family protein n=1 Tax=Conexibacter sp. CPCC 206217 TaxID=3064574 RepID=UPI002719C8F4|nr:patatin-like phospholipase family protein [Conexibacter sp. CPCC 206217]MDO8209674.1 patatin-like phospholipase family protein [Conexibacter sp. CPCC 206217]